MAAGGGRKGRGAPELDAGAFGWGSMEPVGTFVTTLTGALGGFGKLGGTLVQPGAFDRGTGEVLGNPGVAECTGGGGGSGQDARLGARLVGGFPR